jgi:hypothetical protein
MIDDMSRDQHNKKCGNKIDNRAADAAAAGDHAVQDEKTRRSTTLVIGAERAR